MNRRFVNTVVVATAGATGTLAQPTPFFEPFNDAGDVLADRVAVPMGADLLLGGLSATDGIDFELTITTDNFGSPLRLTPGQVTFVTRTSVPGLGANTNYTVVVDNRLSGVNTLLGDFVSGSAESFGSPFGNFLGSSLETARTTFFGGIDLVITGAEDTTFAGTHGRSGRFNLLVDTDGFSDFEAGDVDFYELPGIPAGGIVAIGYIGGALTRVGFFQPDGTLFKADVAEPAPADPAIAAVTTLTGGAVGFAVTGAGDVDFTGDHDTINIYDLEILVIFPEQFAGSATPPLGLDDVTVINSLLDSESALFDVALPEDVFDAFDRAAVYELLPLVPLL